MKRFVIIIALFYTVFVLTRPAYAYLDPGSGSMALQALLGIFAAAMVVIRLYWARLMKFFGFRKEQEPK
jgi:uncharacterized membrane protein